MNSWTEIKTNEELELFQSEIVTFHDSMLKEMQLINRAYVEKNKAMIMSHKYDIRALFQVQFDPVAFELLCLNTQSLHVSDPDVFYESAGKITESPVRLITLEIDTDFTVSCEKLFYKITPEQYGNYEHLGSQIPSDEMQQATYLDLDWWQCNHCSDAWQVDFGRNYSTCPKCGTIAELKK